MTRLALVALASLSLGFLLGILARQPGPDVLIRYSTDGTPRVFGPASPIVVRAARLAVGGRIVTPIPLD